MKKYLLLILFVAVLTGCKTNYGVAFHVELDKVLKDGQESFVAQTSNFDYEDVLVAMNFDIADNDLIIEVYNKTNEAIELVWDKTMSVGPNLEAEKVIHSDVAFIDRNKSMVSTTIPPHSYIADNLTTARSIRYSELYKNWVQRYMYSWAFPSKSGAIAFANENTGKPVRLYFTLIKGDQSLIYDVQFKLINPTFNFSSRDIESIEVKIKNQEKIKDNLSDIYM